MRWKMKFGFLCGVGLLWVSLLSSSSADIVSPGMTKVSYKITFQGDEKFPNLRFFAFPQGRPTHRYTVLSKKVRDVWFSRYRGHLYALKKEQLNALRKKYPHGVNWNQKDEFKAFLKENKVVRSVIELSGAKEVPERTGLTQVERTYSIEKVDASGILLKLVRSRRIIDRKMQVQGVAKTPWTWVILAIVLGAGIFFFVIRNRARQAKRA